jgi:hypothetical protein
MARLTVTLSMDEREYQAMRAWAARRIMTEGNPRKSDGYIGYFARDERKRQARRLVDSIDAAGREAAVDYCG